MTLNQVLNGSMNNCMNERLTDYRNEIITQSTTEFLDKRSNKTDEINESTDERKMNECTKHRGHAPTPTPTPTSPTDMQTYTSAIVLVSFPVHSLHPPTPPTPKSDLGANQGLFLALALFGFPLDHLDISDQIDP